VDVRGEGANRDEALNDALRKAVEKVAGVEITSRTETMDYAVAYDRIISRSRGYVEKYDITKKDSKEYDWKLWIKAAVSRKKIKSDWGQIQMILERMGRPTILVLVSEKLVGEDGKPFPSETAYCSSAVEQLLLDNDFKLKSAQGLKEIERRRRDAALASGDVAALKAIALDYGANVMITGTSMARWNGKRESYGVTVHSYMANAAIKIYRADTAQLLVSLNFDSEGSDMGPAGALTKAYKGIGKVISEKVLRNLLSKWYFEFQHGFSVEIEVVSKSASGSIKAATVAIARFIELLREMGGVDSVTERGLTTLDNTARQKIELKTLIQAHALKNRILHMDTEGMGFTAAVTGADKNTIEVTLEAE
jgi:hypothetical protein